MKKLPQFSRDDAQSLSHKIHINPETDLGTVQGEPTFLAMTDKSANFVVVTDQGRFVFKFFDPELSNVDAMAVTDVHQVHKLHRFCFENGAQVVEPIDNIVPVKDKLLEVTRYVEHEKSPVLTPQRMYEAGKALASFHAAAKHYPHRLNSRPAPSMAARASHELIGTASSMLYSGNPVKPARYMLDMAGAAYKISQIPKHE